MSWPNQCKLKYLSIHSCLYSQYLHILHQLPYLETLQLEKCIMDMNNMFESSSNLLFNSQLSCLIITDCSLSIEHLRSLILKTPKLREFKVIFRSGVFNSVIDIYEWEKFIRIELNFLNRLEFCVPYTNSTDNAISLNSIIVPFRESFWLNEKRWYTVCETVIGDYKENKILLFTIPFTINIDDSYGTITTLNLYSNDIGTFGTQYIVDALVNNTTLTTLNIVNNAIGDDEVKYMADLLETSTSTTLSMASNEIDAKGMNFLSKAFHKNMTLKELGLEYNRATGDGAKSISEALQNNNVLKIINLSSNDIVVDGARYLTLILENNATVKVLNLDSNKISNSGAQYLFDDLQQNMSLTEISLYRADIANAGVKCVADVLRNNMTLQELNLESNRIKAEGAEYLANALRENTTLRMLNLYDNEIGAAGAHYLAEALRNNKTHTLTELFLKGIPDRQGRCHKSRKTENMAFVFRNSVAFSQPDPVGDVDSYCELLKLAESLRNNKTSSELNLTYKQIGSAGAQHIGDALRSNTTLKKLRVNAKEIGLIGLKYLGDGLKNNTVSSISVKDDLYS
ncbi:unnamed protein product [Adineta steineri]|uniref:Uncharacterized protein n=1 Tax=Adineta steineri TaxID=433720 RepID=A0A813V9C4_9BILA|nr:unnamed protein product [Adineta steineri]CAF4075871.1 unnamed protein product [Adineta steineri]